MAASKAASKQVHWGSLSVSVDRLSLSERLFVGVALIGVLVWTFPHITFAQDIASAPLVFEVNNLSLLNGPQEDYFARFLANDLPPKPVDPRIEKLHAYLISKNSSLTDHAEILLQQYHYRLILGISFAESNFCKYQIKPNNCWGIGGGYPEQYQTLAQGVIRANELIQKYQELGMTTPKLMRDTWVGWRNHNWVIAVEQTAQELENLGL